MVSYTVVLPLAAGALDVGNNQISKTRNVILNVAVTASEHTNAGCV
jgi:hypothetical protein